MGGNHADTGDLYPWLQSRADGAAMSLSYLAREWPDLEEWRTRGRAKMQELLHFDPEPVDLQPEVLAVEQADGFTRHTVRYQTSPGREAEAFLLIPDGLVEPAPAVVALHDHGAFYYYGKEKLTSWDGAPKALEHFVERAYEGRPYADELARRGYVVLCPDAFYFGSQRLDHTRVSPDFTQGFPGLASDDLDRKIAAFNRFAQGHEHILAKYLFASGVTWPGVLFQGDRASLTYLLTRPEVDATRVASMGLSIGGFRSAHLFALDPRVSVGVVAGWMPSYPLQMRDKFRNHTWMVYVPGMLEFLDVPDVATLSVPNPLMVLNCSQDGLYPMESMEAADMKIGQVYEQVGAGDRYHCGFYDEPHSLTIQMQEDAFAWLDRWLVKT
ncbi:MAG: hypothetical protein HN712_23085 [Gemmatimonadetes bacterium]|nr:hypothetical protein [Gemmatimonadota bacterium]